MPTLNDEEFHAQALAGGASRDLAGNVPDRGYMVGGTRTYDDLPFPEIKHPVEGFEVDHIRHHAREIRDTFKNRNVHQGAWREGEHVVLDASEQMGTYHEAISAAKSRGERAIYDVEREKDRHVKDARAVN